MAEWRYLPEKGTGHLINYDKFCQDFLKYVYPLCKALKILCCLTLKVKRYCRRKPNTIKQTYSLKIETHTITSNQVNPDK